MRPFVAIVLGAAAAALFALSTSLQALEARETPRAEALRVDLLQRLVRRRRWLLGTLAGVAAWPLQAVALTFGSIALVQPTFGFGLVMLLVLAVAMLGERVGRREIAGVAAVALAVGVLGWAAPRSTGAFTRAGVVVVIAWVVVAALGPQVLRVLGLRSGLATSVAAGVGWSAVGLATALFDAAVADRHWVVAVAWGLGVGAASWGGLLSEMTSLQYWPATRAIPVAFALEMVAPAAVAPLITHHGAGPAGGVPFALALLVACAGAALLGGSRSVARSVALTGP
jgi:drug/metabolite transporter (DMT)-like permease